MFYWIFPVFRGRREQVSSLESNTTWCGFFIISWKKSLLQPWGPPVCSRSSGRAEISWDPERRGAETQVPLPAAPFKNLIDAAFNQTWWNSLKNRPIKTSALSLSCSLWFTFTLFPRHSHRGWWVCGHQANPAVVGVCIDDIVVGG